MSPKFRPAPRLAALLLPLSLVACSQQPSTNPAANNPDSGSSADPNAVLAPGEEKHDAGMAMDDRAKSHGAPSTATPTGGAEPLGRPSDSPTSTDAYTRGEAERQQGGPVAPALPMRDEMARNSRGFNDAVGLGGAVGGGAPVGNPRAPQAEPGSANAEQFKNYGENDFTVTAEDNLSTFSIDVDTASYTIMRNDVLDREQLPNPDSVRVEEYLNYFNYDYASPATSDTPFAVHIEGAPSPFTEGKMLVRVGIKGYEVPEEMRKPANLIFLLDVSGSMNRPNKLPLVQYSLKQLVKKLSPEDTLGIVVYAGRQAVILQPTAVENKSEILDALNSLRAGGSTAGAAGLRTAYELAEQAKKPEGINRVILCTDGDFNVGTRGPELISMVEGFRERGINLSVFLFGRNNINDRDMEQIADKGNGNYAFIDSQSEATRAMAEKVVGALQVIAKDVKIQVEFNKDTVAKYRLIGYENRAIVDHDFRNDRVDAGELGAGHAVTAYYEVELAENVANDANLATVRLRYKHPDATLSDNAAEIAAPFMAGELTADFTATSADFRFGAAVSQYAQILRGSKHVDKLGFDKLIAIAEAATNGHADRDEFMRIAAKASDNPKLYLSMEENGTGAGN